MTINIGDSEKTIQNQILALGRGAIRLFRSNSGTAWQGKPTIIDGNKMLLENYRRVEMMPAGTTDIIGWKSVEITPDMVGQTVAIFTGIEVKRPGKTATKQQRAFHAIASKAGALVGVARSVAEAKKIMHIDGDQA